MSTRISLNGITKRFPGAKGAGAESRPPAAVDNVNLTIEPGELFFLLGPSGCGKTTLLRMIAGFIDPTGGVISFTTADGTVRDVTHLPPNKRNTGMVFQSYALWPHMTVESNVAFGLTVRKVASAEKKCRSLEALDIVRMREYAGRKPNQLSGGQQQRVALARALVVRPDVLLLDEPLSNLDAKLRIELRSEIRRICKEVRTDAASQTGMTTVYVTHDQKEALSMADRVAIMRAGRIVQTGTPGELYRKPRSRFVAEFLGETNFIEGVVRSIEAAPAHSATSGEGSLAAVETAVGVLCARTDLKLDAGARVACSIRPEAFRVARAGEQIAGTTNRFLGSIVESVYLGEIAQHTIALRSPTQSSTLHVKASILNPSASARDSQLELLVDAEDVVLVTE